MASFAQLTPAEIIQDIHDRTVSQIPAEVKKIAEVPPKTGYGIIYATTEVSVYRSTYEGKPVIVKKIDILIKIKNRKLTDNSLTPQAIEKSKNTIITGLFNEIVNYHEVSQIPGHFLCRLIGYKIEYEWTGFLENSTFFVYIVMEDCGEEDLFSFCERIMKPVFYRKYLLENIFRQLMWAFVQALLALQTLHSHGWAHLDLKAENILYNNKLRTVLLGDFGSLVKIGSSLFVNGVVGTPGYIAQELLNSPVGIMNNDLLKKADIYSLFKSYQYLTNGYSNKYYRKELEDKALSIVLGEDEWVKNILSHNPRVRPSADELIEKIRSVNPAYLESYDVFMREIFIPEEAKIYENINRIEQQKREEFRMRVEEEESIKQEELEKNKKSKVGGARRRTKTHRPSKKGRKKRGTQKTNRRRRR
jgi:serine/threonine protein kinase